MSFLGRIFRFESRKSDLDDELRSHLEMAIADRIAAGESREEARATAQREFGNLPLIEDVTRATWGWLWLERILQDVAYAFRQIRRSPGFAVSVIGTLALGIAAATAMFTVVDHVLLRRLPFSDPDEVVAVQAADMKASSYHDSPWQDVEQWIAQARSFREIAFYNAMGGRNFLTGQANSPQVYAVRASSNLFSTLGVRPSLGRDFTPEPIGPSAGHNTGTVILSDAIWKAALDSDPAIIGKSISINEKSYTVIGVMPSDFDFPFTGKSPKVFLPIALGEYDKVRDYMSPNYSVIARLQRGVTVKAATAEISTIQKRLVPNYTDPRVRQQHADAAVRPYVDVLVAADLRKALLALLAAACVLWLIAAVNVTNILFARSAARQREIAMRGALGANRLRILQQFLIEGFLLSGMAALLGTVLAFAAIRMSRSFVPEHLNVDLSTHINLTILAALCALTVLAGVLLSAWPALLAVRIPIEPALRQGSFQAGTGLHHKRLCSVLVAVEVAMSLTLLIACGLLLRTVYSLRLVPLGFHTDHVIVANLALPAFRYTGQNMVANLYQPLLDRVKHIDGVEAAGLMSEVPLGQSFNIELTLAMSDVKNGPASRSFTSSLKSVTPDIQRIFGFPMLAGRFFNDSDTATSQPVALVNRAFAQLYSPSAKDPTAIIGQKLMGDRVIVGILNDQRQAKVAEPSKPEVEICLSQLAPGNGMYQPATMAMDLAVRTDRPLAAIIPELRTVLRQASPELANATFTTMDKVVEDSFGSQRLAAHLLEFFAGSALLVSVAGLYGLLAWVVAQRTREMGVRIALGARRGNLLWLVLRQAGLMLLVGIVAGGALAFSLTRFFASYLYGVSAHDGWTIAAASLLLFFSGMIAAWLPARRAARVDPIQALRAE